MQDHQDRPENKEIIPWRRPFFFPKEVSYTPRVQNTANLLLALFIVLVSIIVFGGITQGLSLFLILLDLEEPARAFRDIILGFGALFGAPFLVWRTLIAYRQTQINQENHYTDLYTQAIEQLGTVKSISENGIEVTIPNIEVRLGAIYALERIAKDSEKDRYAIISTLCAYIRLNNPNKISLQNYEPFLASPAHPTPEDVKSALRTVLALSHLVNFEVNLSTQYFNDLNISSLRIKNINFTHCIFKNTTFRNCNISKVDFQGTKFEIVSFTDQSHISNSNFNSISNPEDFVFFLRFTNTTIVNTTFSHSQLQNVFFNNSTFEECIFYGSNLFRSAILDAVFNDCDFSFANLVRASKINSINDQIVFLDNNLSETLKVQLESSIQEFASTNEFDEIAFKEIVEKVTTEWRQWQKDTNGGISPFF